MESVFDVKKDKIIWDVGHQSYVHKILNGRKEEMKTLRKLDGIAGFPKFQESDTDCFNTGHSSTSISAGLGMAAAREITGEDYHVISVIGDGSLTGGMAYEALNNASHLDKNFIIVLNDNKMSISENLGGMSKYLNSIRTTEFYNGLKSGVESTLLQMGGQKVAAGLKRTKDGIKQFFVPGMLFENMGITYLGPIPGHDIDMLCRGLQEARKVEVSLSGVPYEVPMDATKEIPSIREIMGRPLISDSVVETVAKTEYTEGDKLDLSGMQIEVTYREGSKETIEFKKDGNVTITKDGNTNPSVATIPPIIPACLYPTKVAVFTAMIPGVHCPIA